MAIYAQFDEGGATLQVASNKGWGEFGSWIESLAAAPQLTALWETGVGEDLEALYRELTQRLATQPPPDPMVASVGDSLLHAIDSARPAEFVLITSGVANDGAAISQSPNQAPPAPPPSSPPGDLEIAAPPAPSGDLEIAAPPAAEIAAPVRAAQAPRPSQSAEAKPSLVAAALAEDLDVDARTFAPVLPLLNALERAIVRGAPAEEIVEQIEDVIAALPDVLSAIDPTPLADALEKAMGAAAVQGVRDALAARRKG